MPINLQDGVEVEITEEQLQEMTSSTENNVAQYLRMERNALLAETDWWANSDRTMTQEQIDYRQALRDITDQAGYPTDITWPTKP